MGVDASYVMPYRKGLLKLIQKQLRLGQHYLCHPGVELIMRRDVKWEEEIKYPHKCIMIRICSDKNQCWSTHRIMIFPEEGVVEVDDGRRYYDRDGSKDNKKHNKMVAAYYKKLLQELGVDAWVHIWPDWGGSVGEDPGGHASLDSEQLSYTELLQEMPIEVMTESELTEYIAVHGDVEGQVCDIATAIREGLNDKLKDLLDTEPPETFTKWLRCAVLAQSGKCVNSICDLLADTIIPDTIIDIALKNKDNYTLFLLIQHNLKNNCCPSLLQLHQMAKLDNLDLFEFVLNGYVVLQTKEGKSSKLSQRELFKNI